MTNHHAHNPVILVGIGASAGGLAVLKEFVQALPEDSGMAFIIVQHLDPTRESMLRDILSKQTELPLATAEDNQDIRANHIYVIPPNAYLEVADEKIHLTEPEKVRGSRKAIDHFFRSLAREWGDRCAGIIFSGAGSDGTAGLRSIKAAGGLALAQSPDTAEHPSMPQSAIEAEVVDKVSKVGDLYEILSRFAQHPLPRIAPTEEVEETERAEDSLQKVATILKTHEDFNLDQYKPGTVQRRIARRLSLTNTESYPSYLQLLQEDKQERKNLTKDLLINVTDFFRDKEAFNVLQKEVIPDILSHTDANEDIRVWVAGCATGEEAYSLAILLLEALREHKRDNQVKIFATDINAHAIKIARRGLYPEGIAGEMPKKYLERYFTNSENGHYYQIKNQVRDLISFAVQNVATDPPFNHMHLISCRNLLIYMNKKVQQKILASFYFSLHDHQYLFLGSSENLGDKAELFTTVSKKWRIYQKVPGHRQHKVILDHLQDRSIGSSQLSRKQEAPKQLAKTQKRPSRPEMIREALFATVVPPTVVVDGEGQVLYSHGHLRPYLSWPEGEPSQKITQLVRPAIQSRLRSALYKSRQHRIRLQFHCIVPGEREDEDKRVVVVDIVPIREQKFVDGDAFSIVFGEETNPDDTQKEKLSQSDDNQAYNALERELYETREELQNTIEQLETSTEELKASHEEALSTNEELQSSNEELEASAEELRSLNEELSTVNAQHKEKILDLQGANNDIENFFSSTNIPTIFLNPDLKIQRYTPAAEQLLKMGPGDISRKIASLSRDLLDDHLEEDCREVLNNLQPQRREIQDYKGRWFIRQITPYLTEDRRVEGVVLVFQDVTKHKDLSRRNENREKQQAVVAQLGMLALGGTDPEELMHQAVRQVAHVLDADFCKILKYQPEQHNFLMTAGIGWQDGLVGKVTVPDDQDSQAGYTLISGEPVIVHDLEEEKRFSGPDLLTDHYVTSGISCLINHSDPPYGILGVHTRDKRAFTSEDANFLLSVSNMLSTALRTRQVQDQVFESEEKFRTMANAISQLAWMTDKTGYIFWYNQRWYDYTGTSLEEVQGWRWQKLHHPDHVDRVVRRVKHCFETGDVWEDTFPLRSKTGEYRWFLSRAEPIRDQDGNIIRWFGTNTDVTEQLEQEEALRRSAARISLAKDSAKLGLFEYDIRENQVEWEPMLDEIWGVPTGSKVTIETFFNGLHPEDRDHTQKAIDVALDPEGDGHYEVVYRVINPQNQRVYWIKASGTVLFENDQPLRMIGLINDISDQKSLEFSLKKAKEEAETAARAKEEFLSTMSHEIRTPLNAVIGFSNLLLRKDPRPDQLERLNGLKYSSQSLLMLINDVLDYSKIEAGKVELEHIHYDLPTLLNSIFQSHHHLAEQKDNTLTLSVDKDIPQVLIGDPYKISQVLNNLLSNANKFTENGKIDLKVKKLEQQGEEVALHFSLKDSGVGISSDKLKTIFEKFSQADSSTVRRYGGTGLGLSITKALLHLMQSHIEVKSDVGVGTVFHFKLRQAVGDPKQLEYTDQDIAPPSIVSRSQVRILLAEDTDINRMVLQQHLEEWLGVQADEAVNGQEAVAKAREEEYDLILMDIRMPEMDGVEATRMIRSQGEHYARIPILALTADTSIPNLSREGEERLFNQLVTKPFDPDKLYRVILSLLPGIATNTSDEPQHRDSKEGTTVDFANIENQFPNKDKILLFLEKAQTSLENFRTDYLAGMRDDKPELVSDALHKAKLLFHLLGLDTLYQHVSEVRKQHFDPIGTLELEAELESVQESLKQVQEQLKGYREDKGPS